LLEQLAIDHESGALRYLVVKLHLERMVRSADILDPAFAKRMARRRIAGHVDYNQPVAVVVAQTEIGDEVFVFDLAEIVFDVAYDWEK